MNTNDTSEKNPVLSLPPLEVRRWVLPNGMEVLVEEDHSAPVVSVQAWVKTGSIHEDRHLGAGLSHLVEHMLFKGTEKRAGSGFAQAVQDRGGYINAYTSFDRTVYWIDIPARGTRTALELLADAIQNSVFPAEEFVKEQEVIRREFAMGEDDPDRVAGMRLFAAAYQVHPFRHPVIGHKELFNALTREDALAYYRARYAPNNVFFVVVGAVDAREVYEQLGELFSGSPRQALSPVYVPGEPSQRGRREDHAEFDVEVSRLNMTWHVPGVAHPDFPALDLLAGVLGSGRSSRLYRRVREEKRMAHAIGGWTYALGPEGLFGVGSELEVERRGAVEIEVQAAIAEVQDHGVSEDELRKNCRMSLGGQFHQLASMRGKASDLGGNWLLTGNPDFSRFYLEALQSVTPADVQRVAGAYLRDAGLTVTSLNPRGSASKGVAGARIRRHGEVTRRVLDNGLRVLVREDDGLPLVTLIASFKAGLLAETAANNGITHLLARVLHKGTARRTARELAEEIEAVGGSISSSSGNNSLSVAVHVMEPDLELGVRMLGEVLREASLPEEVISREKVVQLAGIRAEEEDVTVVARNFLREQLMGTHPYGLRAQGTAKSVETIRREDLVALRDRFVVGRNGVLSVFGKVRLAEVEALVERELGGLPSGEAAFGNVADPEPLGAGRDVELIRDKQQAILAVGYHGCALSSPDRAALELIDEACSDLGSRFFVRIREQLGLAYFVGSSCASGLVRGSFVFSLGTDPQKLAPVKAELLDEIRKLGEEGLSEEELTRAREKYLGQLEIRSQSVDAAAGGSALDELYGLGFGFEKELRERVQTVTLEEVRGVARKYFIDQPAVVAAVHPGLAPASSQ